MLILLIEVRVSRVKDRVGQRFGKLTVVEFLHVDKHRFSIWKCQCDCGNSTTASTNSLASGHKKSCGCLPKNGGRKNKTHGGSKTPLYKMWTSMKERCNNPNNHKYPSYGGRGIRVCKRWECFENFIEDMGNRPVGYSLDRIDGEGDYSPENCRWATASTQSLNRRKTWKFKLDGVWYSFKGACDNLGLDYKKCHYRVKYKNENVKDVLGNAVEDYITPNADYKHISEEF